jgi:hypothetical protein
LAKEDVKDPGLNFSHVPDVYIEFEDAPSVEEEPNRAFENIHVIYTINNMWNSEDKCLLFR